MLAILLCAGWCMATDDANFISDTINKGTAGISPADNETCPALIKLNDAVAYTINEITWSDNEVAMAEKAGSEVLARAWFKWEKDLPFEKWRNAAQAACRRGAIFGGGISCSVDPETDSTLPPQKARDMATRGTDGQLITAWGRKGLHHGSLSNSAYLDYLFNLCREQINAGAKYIFFDEPDAALTNDEGYDKASLDEFKTYILTVHPETKTWTKNDTRWRSAFAIDCNDRNICADATIGSFDYPAYLRAHGLTADPMNDKNAVSRLWGDFLIWRNDKAWKSLTDRVRSYAQAEHKLLYLSANGLAKYVDLQTIGMWGAFFTTTDMHYDMTTFWHSYAKKSETITGKQMPIVFFHDWGVAAVPFPWQALPKEERIAWLRTRAAEIYASGAFYAFPVLGPYGCNAQRDGLLDEIGRQTRFYAKHRKIFTDRVLIGYGDYRINRPGLSATIFSHRQSSDIDVHIVNRDLKNNIPVPLNDVSLTIPVGKVPLKVIAISPDFEGERTLMAELKNKELQLSRIGLNAYTVIRLIYDHPVETSRFTVPARVWTDTRWGKPVQKDFRVLPGGWITSPDKLNGFLHGQMNAGLKNPPTFAVDVQGKSSLVVNIRAVARASAVLTFFIDGKKQTSIPIPDIDGKNDPQAIEYNKAYSFDINKGQHKIILDNSGSDWLFFDWLEFRGIFN